MQVTSGLLYLGAGAALTYAGVSISCIGDVGEDLGRQIQGRPTANIAGNVTQGLAGRGVSLLGAISEVAGICLALIGITFLAWGSEIVIPLIGVSPLLIAGGILTAVFLIYKLNERIQGRQVQHVPAAAEGNAI